MFNKNPCVWALLCGVFTTPLVFAQNDGPKGFADTPAQRFIPLPSQSGPNDLSEQAAMLQQLQQMLNLADLLQSSEVQQQLDAENQERLSSLFEDFLSSQAQSQGQELDQFGGQDGEGQDALMREQARKLLEKFSRDREFPPPGQGGNGPSLFPPGANNFPRGNAENSQNNSPRNPDSRQQPFNRQPPGSESLNDQSVGGGNLGGGNPNRSPFNNNQNFNPFEQDSQPPRDRSSQPSNRNTENGLDSQPFDSQNQIPPDFNPFEDTPPSQPSPSLGERNSASAPDGDRQNSHSQNSGGGAPGTSQPGTSLRQGRDSIADRIGRDTNEMNDLLERAQREVDRLRNSASPQPNNTGRNNQPQFEQRSPSNQSRDDTPRFNPEDLQKLLQDPALQEALRKLNKDSLLSRDGQSNGLPSTRNSNSNNSRSANPNNRPQPSLGSRSVPNNSLGSNSQRSNSLGSNSQNRNRPRPSTRPPNNRLRNSQPTGRPESRNRPIDSERRNRENLAQELGSENLPDSFDNQRLGNPPQNFPLPNLNENFDRNSIGRSSQDSTDRGIASRDSSDRSGTDGPGSDRTPSDRNSSSNRNPSDRTWGEWLSDLTAGNSKDAPGDANSSTPRGNQGTNQTAQNSNGQNGNKADDLDVKKTVDRFGLGEALRRIVKDTLDDEGEDTESWLGRNSNNSNNSSNGNSRVGTGGSRTSNGNSSNSPFSGEQLGKWAQETLRNSGSPSSRNSRDSQQSNPNRNRGDSRENQAQSSNSPKPGTGNSGSSSPGTRNGPRSRGSSNQNSEDSVGKLAGDFWKAISSSPKSQPRPSSSSSPSLGSSGSGEGWSIGWQEALILAAVVAGAIMLWLVYKPMPSEEETQESAAKAVAKQLMATGIRTRSDVVTAFHALVLRRPYSASNWWTHWYVADKVNEITPQRESAIADLTQLYEQARYMPPHAKLSDEQIAKAEAAFRTFAAEG